MFMMWEEKKVNQRILIMIVIQMALLILWIPGLEYPDASVHFPKVHNNIRGEVYFEILGIVENGIERLDDKEVVFRLNEEFIPLSWQPIWQHNSYNYISVMLYQGINILLVIASIFLFYVIIKRDKFLTAQEKNWLIRLDLLYFLIPATAYLAVGITPDVAIYLFQPFLFYLLYKNKYFFALTLSVVLGIIGDKSGFICALFVGVLFGVKLLYRLAQRNRRIFLLFVILVIGIPCLVFLRLTIGKINSDNFILWVMQSSIESNGRLLTKYLNFFLESFCFWGAGGYFTLPVFYIAYGWLLVKVLFKAIVDVNNSSNGKLLLAATGMIGGLIIIFPPYSSIRYYMFFPLILIGAIYEYIVKDKYIQNNNTFLTVSSVLFTHNIVLAGLIGIYTFVIM